MSARLRRAALWAASVGVCLAAVGVVATGDGTPPARVDLRAGGAWVGSSVGLLTLIDGDSGEVVARVDVGEASGALVAAQHGPVGYAVDGAKGTAVRVDPRTFETGRATEVLASPSGSVSVHATARGLYVLDPEQGRVAVAAPRDLSVDDGSGESLAEEVGSSVVDRDGRLWLLGGASGDLLWFDGADRHRRGAVVEQPAASELVVADGVPVLVDRAARTVRGLTPDGGFSGDACLDVRAGDDSVRFGGSVERRRVYAVSGDQGVLRASDLGSGSCTDVAVPVFAGGDELGAPVESQGRVFVPNFTAGTVAVVDVDSGRVAVTPEPVAEGAFELFAEDGIVFYNDPDSEKAGVIHLDGSFTAVAKYNPADPSEGVDNLPPADEPDDVAAPDPAAPGPDAAVPPPAEPAAPPPTVPAGPPDTRPARPDEQGTPPPPPPDETTTTTTTSPPQSTTTTTSPPQSTTTTILPPPPPPPPPRRRRRLLHHHRRRHRLRRTGRPTSTCRWPSSCTRR